MSLLTQSSCFPISASDAFGLLRFAPVVIRANGAPCIHYTAPLGVWDGAPIHYKLLQGMQVTNWTATICSVDGLRFAARLAPAFRSPFTAFVAEHSLEDFDGKVILHDTMQVSSKLPELEQALSQAQFAYDFSGRHWFSQLGATAETVSIETLPQSNAAS